MNAQTATRAVVHKLKVARALIDTGMFEPLRPDRTLQLGGGAATLGRDAGRRLHGRRGTPPQTAWRSIDERGTLSFGEVQRRTNALAHELRKAGIGDGDGVAIMCRNHRGFVEATVACSKLGASALFLNTAFAGPQITDVLAREQPVAVIYDEEFSGLVSAGAEGRLRFIAWQEAGSSPQEPTLERADRPRR